MQSFKCPHCQGQIDVFDAKEAEREALRRSETGKSRERMIERVLQSFNRIPGVQASREQLPAAEPWIAGRDIQIVIPKGSEFPDAIEEFIIRDFDGDYFPEVIAKLVAIFRDAVKAEGITAKQCVPRLTDMHGMCEALTVVIDSIPARAIWSYRHIVAGWALTLDLAYRKDKSHSILESVFR